MWTRIVARRRLSIKNPARRKRIAA